MPNARCWGRCFRPSSGSTRSRVEVGLTGEDFYRPWHGHVFTAMCTLEQADEPIDHLTVAEVMRGRGQPGDDLEPTAVEQLLSWVPAAAHGVQYAQIVRDHAQLRRLLAATYEIQAMVAEPGDSVSELIDAAEQHIFKLRGDALRASRRRIEDAVDEEIDRLQQAASDGRAIPGLETGLRSWIACLAGCRTAGSTWWRLDHRWARACSASRSAATSRAPRWGRCCSRHLR